MFMGLTRSLEHGDTIELTLTFEHLGSCKRDALKRSFVRALSCVDGSFYARVNLSDFDVCRLRSCVRPFDAVDNTAGLDEVRALGPNQISELVSPDSASGCPNFSSF